jgi:acyl transferase domain-containing protein/acyl carrier protein/SAM-dependent methyltransferase
MDHTITALEAELPSREMNDLVTEILASSLKSIGLFSNGIRRIADLPHDKQPAPYYERWLDRSIRYLQEQDVLAADLTFRRLVRPAADLWDEWEGKVAAWASDPNRQAQGALLRACLEALPGVLSGSRRATDVMFPNSSMHLVEGIYRGNPQADYFNNVLGRTLSACIEQQLHTDPERKIRIIEIGAGTGGTTVTLLPIVQRYPVEEYCYTDLSKAFLMHAEKHFQPQCPVLTTSIFDVSRPLEPQSVAMNRYDFAIAANVLHATANIRETLRNAKALLKNQGILLLNEISTWSLSNHLTFGLLEGWWLYEDAAARMPGSPGLSPEKWREILTAEGFEAILFPAEQAHQLGQQIIAAASDGWTRQRTMKNAPAQRGQSTDLKPPVVAVTQGTQTSSSAAVLIDRLAADHTRQIITAKLSEALRMDPDAIRADASFADFGVDSIIGVNLVRTISEALQIELETTSLFEYSTVDDLTGHILKNWPGRVTALVSPLQGARETPPNMSDEMPAEDRRRSSEQHDIGMTRFADVRRAFNFDEAGERETFGTDPIAIIGMSGRFAQSESLDALWQHLAEGRDLVTEVTRWSPEECVRSEPPAPGYCTRGSFIDSIDQFDPVFFGISEREATYMDPQQRLFLEESWSALEDAGYAGAGVHEKQCGVYVGCGASAYDGLDMGDAPPQAFWGNSQAVIPARIAYSLNLQGPAIAVDTACSSSLVAIHLACQGLWARETEMAVAGGVFLQAAPGFHQVANRAGMLSPDGKCYSFDARANGFVPGEGVGAVVLKRLRDAMADGDYIHGVIAGSGINQDGRSNGLIAPNGRAQERLERFAYDRFKIDPATIQVVEAHGTGTLLGDSVEHAALSRAFRESTDKSRFCAIGTVKTNIGHASTAAGIAGVLKILLSLRHRQIPPSLHFEKGNPAIDFDSSPFYVNTELNDWNAGIDGVRRAVVSAFGFSGTNAHLIIEEAPAIVRSEDEAAEYLVVLSARSSGQLKQQVRNLLAHLEHAANLAMTDLSFSLLMGRTHFGHRLACVAHDGSELVRLLEQWAESGAAPQVYVAEIQGRIRERASMKKFGAYCIQNCKNSPDFASYRENLAAVAELYVEGYDLDFRSLLPEDARRVPLPTYPFARERYWIDTVSAAGPRVPAPPFSRLHPLLHANTSTIGQQSFACTLTGAEFFLRDQHPGAKGRTASKVVPEAAYLEMARAAMGQAACIPQGSSVMELQNVAWADPMVVDGNKQMTIALFASDDEHVDYEIYSGEAEREIIHCRGRASFRDQHAPPRVDIDELRGQMQESVVDQDSEFAEGAKTGVYFGSARRTIQAFHRGHGQLLAHLSLPANEPASGAGDCDSGYVLHPSLMGGALLVGSWLIADPGRGSNTTLSTRALNHLRILSPCTEEVFVWARHAQEAVREDKPIELDIDLIDTLGNVCAQMGGLSFDVDESGTESADRRTWLFSKEQASRAANEGKGVGSMGAAEKMTLFLRQETALQLEKAMEEIPTDQSFFDLGLTSLGMTHVVQNTCRLLDENLSPSVLFDYRDIESLAAYLAMTYPTGIDAVIAVRQVEGSAEPEGPDQVHAPQSKPSSRRGRVSGRARTPREQTSAAPSGDEVEIEQILESVSWQEASPHDGYEKVTF